MNFTEKLSMELKFIRTSCGLYDSGDKNEAYRIAVALRVICHQTQRSTSLLEHLGATNISLLSTCEQIPAWATVRSNLTHFIVRNPEQVFEAVPKLATARTSHAPFSDWWSHEVVYLLPEVGRLTRKDLVLSAANKAGGAHVDSALDPPYARLEQGADLKVTFIDAGQSRTVPLASCELAALRQMGYEVLNSPELNHLSV